MPVKKVGWRDLAKGVRYMVPPLLDIQRGNLLRLAGLRPASKQSIGKVIEYWARRTPHNIALRFEDQQWTYAQFNAWANRLAACWAEQGVGPGDTVAIMMENRPEALACVAATVKLGAIAGMLAGLGSTLLYIFAFKGWFFLAETNWFPNTAEYWLLGIQPESFGAVGALINFTVAMGVCRFTAAPPAHIKELVESVRIPRGAGAAQDH